MIKTTYLVMALLVLPLGTVLAQPATQPSKQTKPSKIDAKTVRAASASQTDDSAAIERMVAEAITQPPLEDWPENAKEVRERMLAVYTDSAGRAAPTVRFWKGDAGTGPFVTFSQRMDNPSRTISHFEFLDTGEIVSTVIRRAARREDENFVYSTMNTYDLEGNLLESREFKRRKQPTFEQLEEMAERKPKESKEQSTD